MLSAPSPLYPRPGRDTRSRLAPRSAPARPHDFIKTLPAGHSDSDSGSHPHTSPRSTANSISKIVSSVQSFIVLLSSALQPSRSGHVGINWREPGAGCGREGGRGCRVRRGAGVEGGAVWSGFRRYGVDRTGAQLALCTVAGKGPSPSSQQAAAGPHSVFQMACFRSLANELNKGISTSVWPSITLPAEHGDQGLVLSRADW